MKRRVALLFIGAVLLLAVASLLLARTAWVGDALCRELASRVRSATGQPFEIEACRVEPLQLAVMARGLRVGPAEAPIFQAEEVRLRLAPLQALEGALEVAELSVERPRVSARIPPREGPAPACPPPLLARIRVEALRVSEGSLDLTLPGGEAIRVRRFDVATTRPGGMRGLKALTSRARNTSLVLEAEGAEVEVGGRRQAVDAAHVDATVALDLSSLEVAEAWAQSGTARVEVKGSVERLCDPTLALQVVLSAPIPLLVQAAGRDPAGTAGLLAAEVRVSGRPAAPVLEGQVKLSGSRLGGYAPGDVSARFRLAGTELELPRVEVAAAGGNVVARGKVKLAPVPSLEAEARLEGTELGDALARFGLGGAWVSTRVKGEVRASGTLSPLALKGTAALDLADFRVLDGHAWDQPRPGERTVLSFRRGALESRVVVGPEVIRLEDARIRVGGEVLTAQADLHLANAQGFAVELAGGIDLSELGHVASVPIAGRASVGGRLRAAPYGNPRVEAAVRVRDFHFLDLDLGEIAASVLYGGGSSYLLVASDIDGRKGETRYSGGIGVDLGRSPPRLTGGSFHASGRLRDLFEAAMPWLPTAQVARDAIDAAVQADATLSGPSDAVDARFTVRLGPGTLLGRSFDSGQASGRIEASKRAAFDQVELLRGSGVARCSGWVGLAAPFPWELEGSAAGMALADLGLPGARWEGTATGQVQVAGSYERPRLRFAGTGDGVQALGVPVGSVQVGGTLQEEALAVTGSAEGVRFTAEARTSGAMPFRARAELDVDDVTRFLPGGPPAGLRARVRGEARAEGSLRDLGGARSWLDLGELQGGYGDFRVQNQGPVQIVTSGGRVEVSTLTLVGVNTELTVSGAREVDGKLSLGADGTLDLRLLGGLLPGIVRPHGRLQVEGHVSGTVAEPLLVGTGRLRDAGFQIRELPVTFSAMNGDLAFSQNRVFFDHLPALVNGGRAELSGEAELVRFVPSKVRASARLDEVNLRVPAQLSPTVSGQLSVTGSWDSMLLSGRLDVLRAQYTERVDLEKSLLEFRRRTAAPRSFDRKGEWLRFDVALVLGGDIRIENDLVRGGVRGELTLTGTLGSPGLVGSVAMTPGSLATFRGHDFVLTHAVADLTERRRIRAKLDVHGEAQVRDYQILMHTFGTIEDPQVQLSSMPALTQEDIITLLSVGVTSRDTAITSGVGGAATAAAAQALFSAAGLDEQVKRFLPRGGAVRDFSLRITSAYSESSSRVVPKAEFETKVLEWLRLRYQAPIAEANQGRGQQAQLEVRLGQGTGKKLAWGMSLQFQWDNDSSVVSDDLGGDLRLRLEWND
ncbi:MAG: translocation/assembly module TamB domain-containing protein [Deltaproteobacteria bacterium]|nr:translocation/assembly module TamB domain-containing protein [Deltaproteobacteria bacterium]